MTATEYLFPLKAAFEKNANAEKAFYMKKYMKGQYEYFGIASPERREIIAVHKKNYGLIPQLTEKEAVTLCWKAPQREYQYFVMEMLNKTSRNSTVESLEIYEYMITEKSWWDTVDYLAANLVGNYFKLYPENINDKTSEWMKSGNIWLQRTCLLFQLKYKKRLDTKLLEDFILELKDSKEFFIRKAIGWILREYSKTYPEFVTNFVRCHQLSGLSHREALKWMERKGKIASK